MEDIINEIPEYPGEPIYEPEPCELPDMTVERAVITQINGKWYVKGYRDDVEVVTQGGWATQGEHVNAKLYDSEGNEVEHTIVDELDPVEVMRELMKLYKSE